MIAKDFVPISGMNPFAIMRNLAVTLISVIASRGLGAVVGKRYGAWRGPPHYVPVFTIAPWGAPARSRIPPSPDGRRAAPPG
jgi:hypothetical protein